MDRAELSQILKEAFRLYGYELAQAFNIPDALEPLLSGDDAVVTVHLNKNNMLTLTEYVADEECKENLKACMKGLKSSEEEIKNQNKTITKLRKEIGTLQATIEELNAQAEETTVETALESAPEPKPGKEKS